MTAPVYDLAAIVKRETDAEPLMTVTLGKFRFDVPPITVWPDKALAALNEGLHMDAVKALMGEKRYAAFCDAGGSSAALLLQLAEAQGASLPESSASTGS